MALDLTSLRRAVSFLDRAVRVTTDEQGMAALGEDQRETIRAGVIQAFEFTYDQCWKMLKRQIEALSPTPDEVDRFSYRDLLRVGAERGLVDAPNRWFEYRGQRNITSHTYDKKKAESVYMAALQFLRDAKQLLEKLERINVQD